MESMAGERRMLCFRWTCYLIRCFLGGTEEDDSKSVSIGVCIVIAVADTALALTVPIQCLLIIAFL